jgi:hypothetical protein
VDSVAAAFGCAQRAVGGKTFDDVIVDRSALVP